MFTILKQISKHLSDIPGDDQSGASNVKSLLIGDLKPGTEQSYHSHDIHDYNHTKKRNINPNSETLVPKKTQMSNESDTHTTHSSIDQHSDNSNDSDESE